MSWIIMCPLYCRLSSRSTRRCSGRKWEIRNWSSGKQDLRFIFREIHTLSKMCQKCFRKCWQCNTFNLASESFTLKLAHNILGSEILLLFSGILKNFMGMRPVSKVCQTVTNKKSYQPQTLSPTSSVQCKSKYQIFSKETFIVWPR